MIVVKVTVSACEHGGQAELHPFDPEPERTLHRLRRELRTSQYRNLAIMQNNEEHDLSHEQNEP